MGYLLERKTKTIFVTASSVTINGKTREVVIESRPEFAIVQLNGSKEKYPVAWETVYEIAKKVHEDNLRLEAKSTLSRRPRKKKTL